MVVALLVLLLVTALGLGASVLMSSAADHSALSNMGFAVVLLLGLILLLYAVARLITSMAINERPLG